MHSGVDFEDFLSSSSEAFKNTNEDQGDQSELEARERKSNHIKSKTNHKSVRIVVCLSQRTVRDVSDSFLIAKSVRLLVRLKGVLLVRLRTDA